VQLGKVIPALCRTIQDVLVFQLTDQLRQLAAYPGMISEFGYGAHRMISAPIPGGDPIEPLSNFYEGAAAGSGHVEFRSLLHTRRLSIAICFDRKGGG
jgi:hypothetical protein